MRDNYNGQSNNRCNITNAIKFLGFWIVFCVLFFSLQYLFAADKDSYTRVMEHEMYTSEENIDILFLGSSHTYRQYIPSIIDDYLGGYSFNAGSSSQHIDGGLALLKEVGKGNNLDTVFLEVCPSFKGEVYSERTSFVETYIIGDYLHLGVNKIRYLLNAVSEEQYVNAFFPLLRNKQHYYEPGYIRNAIETKTDQGYLEYSHPGNSETDNEWYEDRGYVANNEIVENENWSASERYKPISPNMFSDDELESLEEIVKYCKDNNIRLIFIATPLTDFNLSQYGNYDSGREQIEAFAKNNQIEFYDFNLCKPEYYTYESEKFKDPSHLNCYGAEEYSRLIGRFFSGELSSKDVFYNSYKDKLSEMGNKVFGLIYSIETIENKKTVHFDPIATGSFPVYATITKSTIGSGEEILVEKQKLADLTFDANDSGVLSIKVTGDDPDGETTNIIQIEY